MSAERIAVKVAGGQVVAVPAMRLDWAEKHPTLIGLLDWYKGYLLSEDFSRMTHKDELAKLQQLVDAVLVVSEHEGAVECDLADVRRLYHALRGVGDLADPTIARPG